MKKKFFIPLCISFFWLVNVFINGVYATGGGGGTSGLGGASGLTGSVNSRTAEEHMWQSVIAYIVMFIVLLILLMMYIKNKEKQQQAAPPPPPPPPPPAPPKPFQPIGGTTSTFNGQEYGFAHNTSTNLPNTDCSIQGNYAPGQTVITVGNTPTYVNGKLQKPGSTVPLNKNDLVQSGGNTITM
jgi:preprotein translocase subunit SecG